MNVMRPVLIAFAGLSLLAQGSEALPMASPASLGVSQGKLEQLHQQLRADIDASKHSGYVSMILRDGQIVDWRSYGYQNMVTKSPMQKDSIARIYSMTKLVVSVAAMVLVEDGRLKLSDRVDQYLPALKNIKVFAGNSENGINLVDPKLPITIRHLLTHTAGYYYGFTADKPLGQLLDNSGFWTSTNLDEMIAAVAKIPVNDQPGTRFRYGIHTDILGAVIEKASGQKLETVLQDRIFSPLGMKDTSFRLPNAKLDRLAVVHTRDAQGKLVVDNQTNGSDLTAVLPFASGGGGLFSTVPDYARFAQMLLNGGQLQGKRILSRKSIELMTQNHLSGLEKPFTNFSEARGFGLGFGVMTDLGKSSTLASLGQYGWEGMATTSVQIDPKERLVAILFCQHVPTNEGDIFTTFSNGYYAALE